MVYNWHVCTINKQQLLPMSTAKKTASVRSLRKSLLSLFVNALYSACDMAAQSHTATRDVMFSEPIEKISFSPSLEHGGSESRGWGKRARRRVEMSLPVGYAYRDVTASGLRIQRRHCQWFTNTETSLPVGYEYRDVTACGLRIQRRHCLCFSHTQTSLPISFCFDFAF